MTLLARLYTKLAKKAIVALSLVTLVTAPVAALAKVPNDPGFSDQLGMWQQINALQAWDRTTGSKDVVVAVIDTGADTWHDDLSANIWTNPKEIDDNGLDDDHNGFIDDMHGWNFVEDNNDVRTSVFDNHDDPEAVRHGTVIAGLIGARGDNGRDGVGVSWQVKLMTLRSIGSQGSGSYGEVIRAIDYAVANKADIISMSFVGQFDDTELRDHLYTAYQKGIVIVAAAGNHSGRAENGDLDTRPSYPACFDKDALENWVVTVGSVNSNDKLSSFSNYGHCVDLMAPGEGIYSTERYAPQFGYAQEFGGLWNGTSFAAPLVAGAAALIKSARPDFKAADIIPLLLSSATPIDVVNPGYVTKVGVGRLDVGKALASIAAAPKTAEKSAILAIQGSKLSRLGFPGGQLTTVGNWPGSTIISATGYPNDPSTIAVLLKRGQAYYVRTVSAAGAFQQEINLQINVPKGSLVKKLRIIGSQFLVEQYDLKKVISRLAAFDDKGKYLREVKMSGALTAWEVAADGPIVVYGQLTKSTLKLTQINWQTDEKKSFSINQIQAVDAMALGRFWADTDGQAVLLVRRNKDLRQLVVDVPSGTYRNDSVGVVDAKNPWKVRLVPNGVDEPLIFRFKKSGGDFAAVTSRDAFVWSTKLPALPGTVE